MVSDSFISKTAFALFREWVKNAKEKYPYYSFDIINEQCLVDDLNNAFEETVNYIYAPENSEKRRDPRSETICFRGRVSGVLDHEWGKNYIVKQTNSYRHLCILDAIKVAYEHDESVQDRLQQLYEGLLGLENNLVIGSKSGGKDFFIRYLEDLRRAAVNEYAYYDKGSFLPALLDAFFSDQQVLQIIDFYKMKNGYE